MDINLTLFIQIINFYITYRLLGTFLFKPVIHEIDRRNARLTQITHELKDKEAALLRLQQAKQEQLHQFKNHAEKDFLFREALIPTLQPQKHQPIRSEDIKQSTATIRTVLLEKVVHAR